MCFRKKKVVCQGCDKWVCEQKKKSKAWQRRGDGVAALTLSGFGRPDEHHHHRNSEAF
jgi:hypothetical protein